MKEEIHREIESEILLLVEQYNPEYIQYSQSFGRESVKPDVDIQKLPTATRESPFIHLGYRMSGGTSHVTTIYVYAYEGDSINKVNNT